MHNIPRENILTWFLKVKKILAAFLKFLSNWLSLITLCKNVTVFWGSGPHCSFSATESNKNGLKKCSNPS